MHFSAKCEFILSKLIELSILYLWRELSFTVDIALIQRWQIQFISKSWFQQFSQAEGRRRKQFKSARQDNSNNFHIVIRQYQLIILSAKTGSGSSRNRETRESSPARGSRKPASTYNSLVTVLTHLCLPSHYLQTSAVNSKHTWQNNP